MIHNIVNISTSSKKQIIPLYPYVPQRYFLLTSTKRFRGLFPLNNSQSLPLKKKKKVSGEHLKPRLHHLNSEKFQTSKHLQVGINEDQQKSTPTILAKISRKQSKAVTLTLLVDH